MEINNYIKKDQYNDDYIEVYYNYYDYTNRKYRSILIYFYKKKIIIPKGTIIYKNKINEEIITELFDKSILKINKDESSSIKMNSYIKEVYFEFNEYYQINKFKIKDFFNLVGSIDRDLYKFNNYITYTNCLGYDNLISIMNQILEILIEKEYPIFFHNIFDTYLYRTYFGFFIRLLFFDKNNKIIKELFTMDKINDFIKFFNEWTGNKYLSQYNFYNNFSKAKTTNKKIQHLYENNLIIEKHYNKLKRLSNNNQKNLINYIINKIETSTIEFIKEMYDLIDSEDELFFIKKQKNCIIL